MARSTPRPEHEARRYAAITATIVTVAIVAGVAFAVTKALHHQANTPDDVLPSASTLYKNGSVAPVHFTLPALDGAGSVALGHVVAGRPSVVNFFASWCTACQAELAAFGKTYASYDGKVTFVGVDTDDTDPAKALTLARNAKVAYPLVRDVNGNEVKPAFVISGYPTTFILDKTGRIRAEFTGQQSEATLKAAIDPLLARS